MQYTLYLRCKANQALPVHLSAWVHPAHIGVNPEKGEGGVASRQFFQWIIVVNNRDINIDEK